MSFLKNDIRGEYSLRNGNKCIVTDPRTPLPSGVPWVNALGGGGGAPSSGVMSQNIWGRNHCEGSVATERGEGVGGGFPPPTVGSFFIFRLENAQSGAYLRRKFRLDDMYYMGKRVTIRPTGKRFFLLHELGNIIIKICTPNNLRKISNTCQR